MPLLRDPPSSSLSEDRLTPPGTLARRPRTGQCEQASPVHGARRANTRHVARPALAHPPSARRGLVCVSCVRCLVMLKCERVCSFWYLRACWTCQPEQECRGERLCAPRACPACTACHGVTLWLVWSAPPLPARASLPREGRSPCAHRVHRVHGIPMQLHSLGAGGWNIPRPPPSHFEPSGNTPPPLRLCESCWSPPSTNPDHPSAQTFPCH